MAGEVLEMLPPPGGRATGEPTVRELSPEERESVRSVFAAQGVEMPDPATSTFVGAVGADGAVLGFLVLQLRLHAEPMWIAPDHSDLFLPLAHAAEQVILQRCGPQWVYLFAPAGRVATLAQSMGMALEPWVVMSKLVQPELPSRSAVELTPLEIPVTEQELEEYPGEDYPPKEVLQ